MGLAKVRGSPGRLDTLGHAHSKDTKVDSSRIEDYLELIYELIAEKGYARAVDISSYLHVGAPTVTSMLQRLDDSGLLVYEKHRGVVLTDNGKVLARSIVQKHDIIARFLSLIGVDEETAQTDTEGIEHHMNQKTKDQIDLFVRYIEANPAWFKPYKAHMKRSTR
jgi:Mn-dependent DtxR family transcriptional regulator